MAQLVGVQAADGLIAVLPACLLGHHGMARVDVDDLVVGIGRVGRPRFPKKLHPHPAVIVVPAGLGSGHIFKMPGQCAAGEELPVGNFAAFFVQQPFH